MGKFWRTPEALKNRWNHDLKHRTEMVEGTWVLEQMRLEMAQTEERPKAKSKPRTIKKSFLWGLYTVVREE